MVTEQNDSKYLMKMVKKTGAVDKQVNGTAESADGYIGSGQDHIMTFSARDVADLSVPNVRLEKPKTKTNQNGMMVHFIL